jgi:hypothetical protein
MVQASHLTAQPPIAEATRPLLRRIDCTCAADPPPRGRHQLRATRGLLPQATMQIHAIHRELVAASVLRAGLEAAGWPGEAARQRRSRGSKLSGCGNVESESLKGSGTAREEALIGDRHVGRADRGNCSPKASCRTRAAGRRGERKGPIYPIRTILATDGTPLVVTMNSM